MAAAFILTGMNVSAQDKIDYPEITYAGNPSVYTIGGILGTVTRIKERTIWLRVSADTEIEVLKSSIGGVTGFPLINSFKNFATADFSTSDNG